MKYKAIFANSFSRHEQKKFSYGAFVGCLVILLYTNHTSHIFLLLTNLRFSIDAGLRLPMIEYKGTEDPRLSKQFFKLEMKRETKPPVCDVSDRMTDFCDINGDVRIHGKSSTVLFTSSSQNDPYTGKESWKVKPYPRKADPEAMRSVSQYSVKSFINNNDKEVPQCNFSHNVPAIIFSTAGYSWNHFHAYTDVLIPLFLTSHKFNQEVQFLITSSSQYWIHKYEEIFKHLSRSGPHNGRSVRYTIIDIDNEDNVHCYKRVIVGLKLHKEFDIDPTKSPKGYSMTDFTKLLRNAYAINTKSSVIKIKRNRKSKNQQLQPRLLLVSPKRSRKFTNEDEIVNMARSLGYEVIVAEPRTCMNYSRFAEVVSTCDVMLGVHGAGLTNIVFLPVNAILIQIIPLGGMEWACRTDFGELAKDMKLRYLEYKISEKREDPRSITKQGWNALKDIYLDKQDVHIDVYRFRPTLLHALQLLRKYNIILILRY
ncbi:hypothetical protein MKW98_014471 [Papaver atlanticum]|uniref:Glycosyltransferase 61 catalytic domain-containing protein n=1 Tax=Papaver atlanticum TaxID=357466 RepID=A0AAD4S021_9MAGN|nr:hypothetical protein MKW98_014471 [Papaver atlanticum]